MVVFKKLTLFVFTLLFFISYLFVLPHNIYAITNPLDFPNNKIGVHILFPSEIYNAAKLVNGNGGEWGYVVIPIQAKDRDMKKWQKFMTDAKNLRVVPIIRIATAGEYFNTAVWQKPTNYDLMDFANFLNSLDWPTKNRYVVVFNEPNRSDEWGGSINASEYAKILDYAIEIFKAKSEDFFIISAGFDNASSNIPGQSINQYIFIKQMNTAVAEIFNKVDGIASHSYPNPGFKQPPYTPTPKNIYSFKYEQDLIYSLSGRRLPIFITETGWSSKEKDSDTISNYWQYALSNVWTDDNIVAITPFLLEANGMFSEFTLLSSGRETNIYSVIKDFSKTKGSPQISDSKDLSAQHVSSSMTYRSDSSPKEYNDAPKINLKQLGKIVRWMLKI